MIERWKQNFDEHAENVGSRDQGSEGNDDGLASHKARASAIIMHPLTKWSVIGIVPNCNLNYL